MATDRGRFRSLLPFFKTDHCFQGALQWRRQIPNMSCHRWRILCGVVSLVWSVNFRLADLAFLDLMLEAADEDERV